MSRMTTGLYVGAAIAAMVLLAAGVQVSTVLPLALVVLMLGMHLGGHGGHGGHAPDDTLGTTHPDHRVGKSPR